MAFAGAFFESLCNWYGKGVEQDATIKRLRQALICSLCLPQIISMLLQHYQNWLTQGTSDNCC